MKAFRGNKTVGHVTCNSSKGKERKKHVFPLGPSQTYTYRPEQTSRQTIERTDRQTDRQTNRQTDRQAGRPSTQSCRQTNNYRDRLGRCQTLVLCDAFSGFTQDWPRQAHQSWGQHLQPRHSGHDAAGCCLQSPVLALSCMTEYKIATRVTC